jgi:hypothetical protein
MLEKVVITVAQSVSPPRSRPTNPSMQRLDLSDTQSNVDLAQTSAFVRRPGSA